MSHNHNVEISRSGRKSVVIGGKVSEQIIEVRDPGVAGPPNVLTVGTVTQGTTAQVTITGVAPSQTINFVLPTGGVYTHTQSAPSSTWAVVHNLGYFPSVSVVDSGGTVVIGDVIYVSENEVSIEFSSAFGGKAYLS